MADSVPSMEPVNKSHIKSFRYQSDIETGAFLIRTDTEGNSAAELKITAFKDGKQIAVTSGSVSETVKISIPDFRLWTPENPVLYDLVLELIEDNKVTDKLSTLAGLRKVSLGKTPDGFTKILLNNRFVSKNGPLDQGFWPDGIYTPPSRKAMIYDLQEIKRMGFNMLRKHVKGIFYNWCDKLGILVWQDMPSGDAYISGDQPDIQRSEESASQFEYELKEDDRHKV